MSKPVAWKVKAPSGNYWWAETQAELDDMLLRANFPLTITPLYAHPPTSAEPTQSDVEAMCDRYLVLASAGAPHIVELQRALVDAAAKLRSLSKDAERLREKAQVQYGELIGGDDRRDAERYRELIYAVGNKYQGETRHQTALRYIQRAEAGDAALAAKGADVKNTANTATFMPIDRMEKKPGITLALTAICPNCKHEFMAFPILVGLKDEATSAAALAAKEQT